ncbi:MAG: hypothetical protein ACJ8F3_12110 [Xanthobacteraceae bacterium]
MPKSKPKPPDVKAIATRAERARPRSAGLSAQERAAERRRLATDEKRLRASLAKSMDVAEVERFAREREKSDLERARVAHRRAIEASSERAKWLSMTSVPPNLLVSADGEDQFVVDTALFMRAWPNTGALRDFSSGPGDNWGKYWLQVDGDILDTPDEARLSFYALWQNSRDVPVTVRTSTRINVNAHVAAHADARYFMGWMVAGASVDATLRARFTVSPLWQENTQLVVAEEPVGSVAARGGFLSGDDDTTIFTSASLDGTITLAVPPGRFLMFETSLVTGWKIDSGNLRVDADNGALRVDVPFWIVTIVA